MCDYAGCVSLRLLLKLRWPTLSAVPERILCKPRQTDSGPTRHWSEPTLLHTVTWKDCRRENTLIRLYGSPEGQTKKCLLWFIYFLILIQLVFCFWRVFFFLPEYSGECFFTSETLFNFSFSVELTRKMCETEWKTFTWKSFLVLSV